MMKKTLIFLSFMVSIGCFGQETPEIPDWVPDLTLWEEEDDEEDGAGWNPFHVPNFIYDKGIEGLDEDEVNRLMLTTNAKEATYELADQFYGAEYINLICSIFSLPTLWGEPLESEVEGNYDPKTEALLPVLPNENRNGEEMETRFDSELIKYAEQILLFLEATTGSNFGALINQDQMRTYLMPERTGGEIPNLEGLLGILSQSENPGSGYGSKYGTNPYFNEYENDVLGGGVEGIELLTNVFKIFELAQNEQYLEYYNAILTALGGDAEDLVLNWEDDQIISQEDAFNEVADEYGLDMNYEDFIDGMLENMDETEAGLFRNLIEEMNNGG